ncbi:hypothetical protein, partial [Massiliimalia timonensis]|uniref:hypothetical protein n=1 Tax=Massiliimalia timonensis TaxID=1987501 RepID=UPI001A9BD804
VFQQLSERQRLSEQCECNEYLFFCSGRLFGLELSEQSELKEKDSTFVLSFSFDSWNEWIF